MASGTKQTLRRRHSAPRAEPIERVGYQPQSPYRFDIEVFSWRILAARVPPRALSSAHRIEFHELICITRGSCTHVIDFEPLHCEKGSVLVSSPGQTEQFDVKRDWDGWLVLFRPEFLFNPIDRAATQAAPDVSLVAALSGLQSHLALPANEHHIVRAVLARMHRDSIEHGPAYETHGLLRHQLCALLLRLARTQRLRQAIQPAPAAGELQRFRRFQQLLEQSFATSHQVSAYASAIGCTEKTLSRAALAGAGVTAKRVIATRIALEAKRMLVQTALAVARIADELGFDDSSNFVKFFRREVGCTPMEFRARHPSPDTDVRNTP